VAALSDADRAQLTADFQSDPDLLGESFGAMTKADLRAAVNALDDYLDANATTINAAIPQPARGALTSRQKARLLVYVIRLRYSRNS
jgi:hypothetical protein